MNNSVIAILFALAVGAILIAPIVAAEDASNEQAVSGELDMDIEVLPGLGNLTGEIMIQFLLEPSFHADPASARIVLNKEDLIC